MSKKVVVNEGVEADLEAMKADAERIGVEVPSKASAKKLAELLRKKYKEKLEDVPKDDWVQCETCGEITDDDPEIEACPFCGDEGVDPDEDGDGEEEAEGDGEAESPSGPEKLDEEEDEDEGDDGEEEEDEDEGDDGEEEDVAEAVKGQKSRAEKQREEEDEDDDTPAPREPKRVNVHAEEGDEEEGDDGEEEGDDGDEEEKPAAKSKGKKKTSKKKAPAKGKKKTSKRRDTDKNTSRKSEAKGKGKTSKSSTKPAKTKGDDADKTQEQLFEESKDRILTYKRELTERGYDLGLELKRQHEQELWKVEGHKHFRAFVESVGVSHTFAYQLMKIVKDFSREQYIELGPKKLAILGKVPESQRKGLEEKAKGGASSTDLSREASKSKGKGKGKGDDDGIGEPPLEQSGKRGRPSKEDQKIELLTKVGGKAKTYSFVSRDGKELKEWERDAYVKIQLSDDVVQYIGLKTDRSGKKIVGVSTMFTRVEDK